MEIVKVEDKLLADICDELLTLLIVNERKYDTNIRENLVVHDWYSSNLKDKNRVTFAAIEEGEVVGFIHGLMKEIAGTAVKETVVMIDALYVKEKNRKQGISTALIQKVKEWSKTVSAKYIDLNVLVDNKSAVELYEKNGFKPFKIHMRTTIK